jgi:hypothetical protein
LGPSRESTLPRQEAIKGDDDDDTDVEGGKLADEERISEKMTLQQKFIHETGNLKTYSTLDICRVYFLFGLLDYINCC